MFYFNTCLRDHEYQFVRDAMIFMITWDLFNPTYDVMTSKEAMLVFL